MPDSKTSVCVKLMYILCFVLDFFVLMNRRIASSALTSTTVIIPHPRADTISVTCK